MEINIEKSQVARVSVRKESLWIKLGNIELKNSIILNNFEVC